MNKSAVVTCYCSHVYQDAVYGRGRRFANPVNKEQKKHPPNMEVRCTVCGMVHKMESRNGTQ